jgi:hypothetical protein
MGASAVAVGVAAGGAGGAQLTSSETGRIEIRRNKA